MFSQTPECDGKITHLHQYATVTVYCLTGHQLPEIHVLFVLSDFETLQTFTSDKIHTESKVVDSYMQDNNMAPRVVMQSFKRTDS